MASPTQVTNGRATSAVSVAKEITLDYDPKTYAVSVTPNKIGKGSTIRFRSPKGKVRVVFVSPFNTDSVEMLDSEQRTLTVGGCYHFRCFFKSESDEYGQEIESPTGGVLDIEPHRP